MGKDHLDVEPRTIKRAGAGINSSAQHLQTEWERFQAELRGRCVTNWRTGGQIRQQIHNLPDGTPLRIRVIE